MRPHLIAPLGLLVFCACDTTPTVARFSGCRPFASVSPPAAAIHIADTLRLASTIESGCPSPLVRNDTPAVIRLDSISAGIFRVTGLTVGAGRVRVVSPIDTTVAASVAVTVTLP